MEGAVSVRSPGNENSERQGPSCRDYKGICSKRKLSSEEKEEDEHPYERQKNTGFLRKQEGSQRRANARQSYLACRQKRHRKRPRGSPCSHHKENGSLEEKGKGRSSPNQERGNDKPEPTRAGHHYAGGSVHAKLRRKDSRTQPRSPARTAARGHCKDILEARPTSPKRQPLPSPEVRAPLRFSPLSRVFNQVNALEVALRELQAPGGAFLRVPARGTQPTVSQRAWLTWQLTHAGAALHWALARIHAMLAAQPWPACPPGSTPAPRWR